MRRAWTSAGALLLVLLVTSGCRRRTDAEGAAGGSGVDLIGMRRLDTIAEIRRFELSNWRLWNLLDGWSERPEWSPDLDGGFVWAVARDASLWFYVLDVRDFQFLVKLAAAPQLQSQRITALVNGQPVSDFEAQAIFQQSRWCAVSPAVHAD